MDSGYALRAFRNDGNWPLSVGWTFHLGVRNREGTNTAASFLTACGCSLYMHRYASGTCRRIAIQAEPGPDQAQAKKRCANLDYNHRHKPAQARTENKGARHQYDSGPG